MRRISVRSIATLLGVTLATAIAPGTATAGEPPATYSGDDDCCWVAVTDQAAHEITVLDPTNTDWNTGSPRAVKWRWSPHSGNGFSDPTPGWGLPDEARLRYSAKYRTRFMLVTDSYGFIGLIHYPTGHKKWAVNVQEGPNPHAAELLPDGNVAAAASTGGWVRLYTASQGPDATTYVEYPLVSAHGVLWDPQRQVLWALGYDKLVALRVGGTPAAPTLTEVASSPLPTIGGHDLQPVYGDRDRLWVSSETHVYQYAKSTNSWHSDYRDAAKIDLYGVKTVGANPATGQVLLTRPKAGCRTTWCTDTVEFFGPDTTRTRAAAEIYKARWWYQEYQ